MTKIFSTKLDAKVLKLLDQFCERYHLKKSYALEQLIVEGVRRRAEAIELAESLARGLEDEREKDLYTAEEVERFVFGKKKPA